MVARAPFSRAAEGARLPDGNPNLSTTLALTRKFRLVANEDGELDVTVLPNLYCSAFTTRGSIGDGAVALALAPDAVTANTRNSVVASSGATGTGFDTIALASQYSRYRIVGYGARLRSTTGVSSLGEYTCAVLPLKGQTPTLTSYIPSVSSGTGDTLTSNSFWGASGPRNKLKNVLESLGLPWTGADNTAKVDATKLVNVPCHAVASTAQIATRGLHMRGLPYESSVRDYVTMNFNAVGIDSLDVASETGNAAGATYATQQVGVDMSFCRVGGLESLVITAAGLEPSMYVGTVEVIYHLEAITNPAYAVLARPTGQVPRVGSSQTLDQVLTTVHRIPRVSFADVVQTAGDAMLGEIEGQVGAGAGRAVSGLGGMLGRLLVAGV